MPYGLKGFAAFCRVLGLKLETFQRFMLTDYFAGVRETVIIIPKKNGKTTILAALALYHLLMVERAECVIGAASRDQATLIFRQAEMLVDDAGLGEIFKVRSGYRHIYHGTGRIRVLAADANTADGVIPTLALVDELHRHPSDALYGVFRDGLGPRDGQMITISTAGATIASPLGRLRRLAYELKNFKRDEVAKRTLARSDNGKFVLHEWCLSDEDDPADITLVKKANPAPWVSRAWLAERHDAPTTTPSQWLRFACGVWTEGEDPWMLPGDWDSLAVKGLEIEEGSKVWMCVDAGTRSEAPAIAYVMREGFNYRCKARLWPVDVSVSVPLAKVEAEVRVLAATYDAVQIAYDTRGFGRSAEMLGEEGYPMLDFPQTSERMIQAAQTFSKLCQEGRILHDGDPELRAHVLGAQVRNDERGWRWAKNPNSPQAIDALIALAVAVHIAETTPGPQEPMFRFGR